MQLVESPYRTAQTRVGGRRKDAALLASSDRTATTNAMGKGATQHQHLVPTEVPKKLLEEWLAIWGEHHRIGQRLSVALRPLRAGSELLELAIVGEGELVARAARVLGADARERMPRDQPAPEQH
ncbi:hypothetical protein MCHLDSM_02687 [Mycolicibacterium chlorophenolicum]|uniref:Uncharacterized protein n=1 Tax=Mycolicibacterium chlorophenolicum TaxID=37916 RepID=A0A0J6W5P9_9MYCO|nr:hypothetical protein MCHLDSM_02687 [Mycolicibacterium chlorophenolicum]